MALPHTAADSTSLQVKHPLVYEINTRCWLWSLSQQSGRELTLANVPEELFTFWRNLGFTHVWLMGVWRTGPRARQHSLKLPEFRRTIPACTDDEIAGSPYAIAAYEVSESLGGTAALQIFRKRLNGHGLRLILDFVPNHLGLDHSWLDERPDLFVGNERKREGVFRHQSHSGHHWFAHGKDPYFDPWTDTVQLEYRNPATREAMVEQLISVAGLCDGVRCDMAMLLLNDVFATTWKEYPTSRKTPPGEFWAEATSRVRTGHADFEFIAEVYWGLDTRLQELGFDYTYDKRLYDHLVARNAAAVQKHLLEASQAFIEKGVHFIENHDEPRAASLLSLAEHRAAAIVITGLPGMCLLHEGQLSGARERLSVHLGRRRPEPEQVEITAFYGKLLEVFNTEGLRNGQASVLRPTEAWPGNPTAVNFVIVEWSSTLEAFYLVVVNLAAHASQCYVNPSFALAGQGRWSMANLLGSETYERDCLELKERGLFFDVPGHGAQIFAFRPLGDSHSPLATPS